MVDVAGFADPICHHGSFRQARDTDTIQPIEGVGEKPNTRTPYRSKAFPTGISSLTQRIRTTSRTYYLTVWEQLQLAPLHTVYREYPHMPSYLATCRCPAITMRAAILGRLLRLGRMLCEVGVMKVLLTSSIERAVPCQPCGQDAAKTAHIAVRCLGGSARLSRI